MIWDKGKIGNALLSHRCNNVKKKYSIKDVLTMVSTCVQIIAILVAGRWGYYTFNKIYKEIPEAAPVNITIDLQLKKIIQPIKERARIGKGPLIALDMVVVASNPSPKTVHLLPSIWVARAGRVKAADRIKPELVFTKGNIHFLNGEYHEDKIREDFGINYLNSRSGDYIQMEAMVDYGKLPIALGSLTTDKYLNPGEKISRRFVFHVPNNEYDFVTVVIRIPSVEKTDICEIEWSRNDGDGVLRPEYYQIEWVDNVSYWWESGIRANKTKKLVKLNDPKEVDALIKKAGFQTCSTVSTISLWQ